MMQAVPRDYIERVVVAYSSCSKEGGRTELSSSLMFTASSYYCQQLLTTFLQFPAYKVISGSLRAS